MGRSEPAPAKRVVVTGLGAVCALGWGVAPLWQGLRAGRTGLGPFSRFDASRQRTRLAGEVPPAPPAAFRRPPGWGRLAYADRFALFAATEAVAQAQLQALPDGTGVFFGTSTGGLIESERFMQAAWHGNGHRPRLGLMASHHLNAPGDAIARQLNVNGPVHTVSSACASAALAIEAGLRAVRSGEVDCALAGGSDSLCSITYSGFNALRAMDEGPCRPFREDRKGMSLGEGSAVLVIESLEAAVARGARPLAELLGAGASCDASHMTAPDREGRGAAAALRAALVDAGLEPESVGFVNAHGTGTPLNDAAEWAAFASVFGTRAPSIPVSATKGIVGHLLGSAGAIEAVATVLCLQAAEAHPVANAGQVDPKAPVDLVLGEARRLPAQTTAVSTSLGFGGANAVLIFASWGA